MEKLRAVMLVILAVACAPGQPASGSRVGSLADSARDAPCGRSVYGPRVIESRRASTATLASGRGTLAVQVAIWRDGARHPLHGAIIDLFLPATADAPVRTIETDSSGTGSLSSLSPGQFRLVIRAYGYDRQETRIEIRDGFLDTLWVETPTVIIRECPTVP